MNALRQPWTLMRLLRLLIGSVIIYQSVGEQQPILAILGAFFVIQALMNTGCGPGGCQLPRPANKSRKENKFVDYEEVE